MQFDLVIVCTWTTRWEVAAAAVTCVVPHLTKYSRLFTGYLLLKALLCTLVFFK